MTRKEFIRKTLKAIYGKTLVSPEERRLAVDMAARAATVYAFDNEAKRSFKSKKAGRL